MAIKAKSRQVYEARARVAKALAHPSRLLMLDALQQGEMCVGDLSALVGADQSTVSKHLAVLRNVGLVNDRRDGPLSYYRLEAKCLGGFFGCIESVLKANLKAQQKTLAAK